MKSKIKLCFVDDDDQSRKQSLELAEKDFPSAEVRAVSCTAHAYRGLLSHTLLIVDISAAAGDSLHPEWAYGPLRMFMRDYGRTRILITSGMSINAVRDFVEDLKKFCDNEEMASRIHFSGWFGDWKKISDKIKELHPDEEYEY